jgi:hypothetical protein
VEALLDILTRREIVVGLAVVGAIVATIGSMARGRPAKGSAARAFVYAGYAITGASVLLFIAAGFRS